MNKLLILIVLVLLSTNLVSSIPIGVGIIARGALFSQNEEIHECPKGQEWVPGDGCMRPFSSLSKEEQCYNSVSEVFISIFNLQSKCNNQINSNKLLVLKKVDEVDYPKVINYPINKEGCIDCKIYIQEINGNE